MKMAIKHSTTTKAMHVLFEFLVQKMAPIGLGP